MIAIRLLFALLSALLLSSSVRAAIDVDDLLPIDEAFALQAIATDSGRIEFTWTIADGYYLYRHRMSAKPVDVSSSFDTLALPGGEKYTDEFFGEVETYRDTVTGVLTGVVPSGTTSIDVDVRYQGCADVGVCYPPHQKRVTVALPADGRDAMRDASAAPAASPFAAGPLAAAPANPLGLGLQGNAASPLIGGAGGGVTDALPLPAEEAFRFEAIAASPTSLLLRFTPTPGYYLYRDRSTFTLVAGSGISLREPQWPEAKSHTDEHFGDVAVYFDEVEVPMAIERATQPAQTVTLEATFQGCQTDGICYPPMTRRVDVALPLASADELATSLPPETAGRSTFGAFVLAVLLALGGGLILNLMPCVLPVLSLKALSLAESGRSGGHARSSALWYTAGVLVTFAAIGLLALGLRAAGEALGWGFQLQQPLVIAALAFLMVAIGLNLSGLYSIGGALAGSGQGLTEKPGRAGDFFTGVLAVVVASPCTAPFMGTALAFAFAAPTALALGVFLALGLGLALPFLLIGFIPSLARLLPRPGLWMETFKQVLAFPMYGTAIWLLWVLGNQRGVDAIAVALAGMIVLAAGLWWWGRQGLQRAPLARAIALLLVLLGVGAIALVPRQQSTRARAAGDDAQPYSASALDAARAEHRVVFVNMTADWCVTCKVNEKRVLDGEAFRTALASADALYMKGDWTEVDPQITRFLEAHGAVGVPLYVVFPRDGGEGEVLPTVLTQSMVDAALARAVQ
jgi:thiol:disulfide interchange protein